jgi:hypothetical protein
MAQAQYTQRPKQLEHCCKRVVVLGLDFQEL